MHITFTYRHIKQHKKWHSKSHNQQNRHIYNKQKILDDRKQHVNWSGSVAESFQRHKHGQPGEAGTERSDIPLPSLRTPVIISIPNNKHEGEKRQHDLEEYPKPGLLENGQLSNINSVSTDA